MTNLILIAICTATIISTVISFAKPAYEGLVKKKYVATISIGLAFILGLIASFSFDLGLELSIGAKILIGLGLGTGSTVWYDIREILKALEQRLAEKK